EDARHRSGPLPQPLARRAVAEGRDVGRRADGAGGARGLRWGRGALPRAPAGSGVPHRGAYLLRRGDRRHAHPAGPHRRRARPGQAHRLVHDAVARRGSREDRPEGRRGSGRDGGRSHERRPGAARQRGSGPHLSSIRAAPSQATPPRPRARGAGRPSPLGGVMPFVHLHTHSDYSVLDGFYRRPRIDREALEQHRDGLIGLAACLSGEIALYLRQGNYEAAKASASYFAQLFGNDGFWLEVQDHGLADEKVVAAGMYRLAQELGLPVVATNDAHYLRKDDAEAHDVLLAIGTGKDLDDPNRFRFFGQESYVKSEAEMRPLFTEHPDVLVETARVAELCEFDFEKRYFLPQFPRAPEFASDNDLLVHLARAGARGRYGDPLPPPVAERLAYELGVISHTGYAGYFLI